MLSSPFVTTPPLVCTRSRSRVGETATSPTSSSSTSTNPQGARGGSCAPAAPAPSGNSAGTKDGFSPEPDPAADLTWHWIGEAWNIREQTRREATHRLIGRAKLDLETATWHGGRRRDPRLRPWLLRRARAYLREALARGLTLRDQVMIEREAAS